MKEALIEEKINAGEVKILPLDLAMQLFPLIKDYFCGKFAKNCKGILMMMENGQVFQLKIENVNR